MSFHMLPGGMFFGVSSVPEDFHGFAGCPFAEIKAYFRIFSKHGGCGCSLFGVDLQFKEERHVYEAPYLFCQERIS